MTDSNGTQMYMPVAPAYGMGGGGGGFGFGGDSGAWWLLILLVAMGGWGGFGNNGNGGGGGFGSFDGMYPWLNNSNQINDGFRDQMLNDSITSIRDGVTGISTQLCNGFASVNQGVANGFAQAEIAANARQMADMNQSFANQTAVLQGFNGLQSQLAQCLKKAIHKAKNAFSFTTRETVGTCAA